jgi:hypothetical protein
VASWLTMADMIGMDVGTLNVDACQIISDHYVWHRRSLQQPVGSSE